jgi:hypothetical protein
VSYFVSTEKATPRRGTDNTVAVSISAIQFDASGDDRKNINGEWVQLTNAEPRSADMTGWQMYDESGRVYVIPRFALSPGASVKISTGKGSDGATELYMGRGSPVWNNDGDTAILKDADGNAVSQRSG